MRKIRLGLLHTVIRPEEKYLINEFRARAEFDLKLIDQRQVAFELESVGHNLDLVLNRSIDYARSLNALRVLETFGVRCISSADTAQICGDKLRTALALKAHGVAQPHTRVAFSETAALQAMEEIGFPVVLKPAVGSWGRLLSKINDRETAVAVLEHKKALGSYHHQTYFLQEYIAKRNRDLRIIVIGNECVAASYRTSEHWITNAARGAQSLQCPLTDELRNISIAAAKAVGGDIIAVDLFETKDGYLVNEVNHTLEFKSCLAATGQNIPGLIADYVAVQAYRQPARKLSRCADSFLFGPKTTSKSVTT